MALWAVIVTLQYIYRQKQKIVIRHPEQPVYNYNHNYGTYYARTYHK